MKITERDNIYDVIKKYPKTIDYFISNGIKQVENDKILFSLGRNLKIDMILKSKKLNKEIFLKEINEIVLENDIDKTLKEKQAHNNATINISGVLPCPIRIPLLDSFEKWIKENNKENLVNYDLKAASMGVDWLKDSLKEESISDIFLSAGFDLFFDNKYMNQFKKKKIFKDLLTYEQYNEDFNNDYISLKDENNDYSIIGVVPAVFLINDEMLKGRKVPKSWKELISGEYDNSVSLPIGDFDLFNAILLNIYKEYDLDGIKRLAKTLLTSLHPSQMVNSHTMNIKPAVTIMPYFFTKMAKFGGPMNAIWPKDGAIISPIFMLAKREKEEELLEIANFFGSKEVAQILAHKGLFPTTHPDVDNKIDKKNKYKWVGWDYINNNDIGKVLETCINEFKKVSEEKV